MYFNEQALSDDKRFDASFIPCYYPRYNIKCLNKVFLTGCYVTNQCETLLLKTTRTILIHERSHMIHERSRSIHEQSQTSLMFTTHER